MINPFQQQQLQLPSPYPKAIPWQQHRIWLACVLRSTWRRRSWSQQSWTCRSRRCWPWQCGEDWSWLPLGFRWCWKWLVQPWPWCHLGQACCLGSMGFDQKRRSSCWPSWLGSRKQQEEELTECWKPLGWRRIF